MILMRLKIIITVLVVIAINYTAFGLAAIAFSQTY
jgi:hypothetical protein